MDTHDKLRTAIAGLLDAEQAHLDDHNATYAAGLKERAAGKRVEESRAKVVRALRAIGRHEGSDGATWREVYYSIDPNGNLAMAQDGRLRLDQD